MHPTMSSEFFFFIGNSVNRFFKVTTRDTQLLNLSAKVSSGLSTWSTLINLSSVYFNPNFLCKNKDSYAWFQTAAVVWFL